MKKIIILSPLKKDKSLKYLWEPIKFLYQAGKWKKIYETEEPYLNVKIWAKNSGLSIKNFLLKVVSKRKN